MNAPAQDRARAARHLVRVLIDGKTIDQTFGIDPARHPSPLCQELVYGVLRYFYTLNEAVEARLSKSLRSKDLDLRCLMLVGAYQLQHTRIPAHAAINETVNACRPLRKPWARSLVNGVLRSLSRDPDSFSTERSFNIPQWIENRIRGQFPDQAEITLMGLLERAPMALRVNLARNSVAEYCRLLDQAELAWQPGLNPDHLILTQPCPAGQLPGYAQGKVSIQDGGAQLAAGLLLEAAHAEPPHPAETGLSASRSLRILDACAAPGGKLFHLAERLPQADITALELRRSRFEHLQAEAQRLGHTQVRILEADATGLDWWDEKPFDLVLLDAPCSGIGTLRRHPDIKHLRDENDLPDYQMLQLQLLRNLWRALAAGGTLLYCTCSLFQEENDTVVHQFISATDDASIIPLQLDIGMGTDHGWQLLPATIQPEQLATSVDGFYYARLRKTQGGQHG